MTCIIGVIFDVFTVPHWIICGALEINLSFMLFLTRQNYDLVGTWELCRATKGNI